MEPIPPRLPTLPRALVLLLVLVATGAGAERLPIRVLTSADGLAGDAVLALFEDSRGYLWIGTTSGLSRFDGFLTRSYDVGDGLPSPRVGDIKETADGAIWVATAGGLARLSPDQAVGGEVFARIPLPGDDRGLSVLLVARDGTLYVGGPELWHLDPRRPDAATIGIVALPWQRPDVQDLAQDAVGNLYAATERGLLLLRPDGSMRSYEVGGANVGAEAVVVDTGSRLWVGGPGGLFVLAAGALEHAGERSLFERSRPPRFPGEMPEAPGDVLFYSAATGLADDFIYSLGLSRAGTGGVWVATRQGVTHLLEGRVRTIGTAQGLPEAAQVTALEDRDGSVWIGSESCGVARLADSGFVAYGEDDGLVGDRAVSLFDGPGGALFTVTWSRDLNAFDGRRFEAVTPRSLYLESTPGWGWNQYAFFDRRGALWFPTNGALARFAPVADPSALRGARPERRWTPAEGLPGHDIFRLYEDRLGNVWISSIAVPPLSVLIGGETLEAVPETMRDGTLRGAPTAFAEDAQGHLWMGFYVGGLARVKDGEWQFFGPDEGVPAGLVSDLHLDRSGRLWAATTLGGLARIDLPGDPEPRIRPHTTDEGLSTNSTRCLVEDQDGRLWVGTSRGIDLLDAEGVRIRSFSTQDGLPNNLVAACHAGADGSLWFGTLHGLARFEPPRTEIREEPEIRITAVTVAGRPWPIPELGARQVTGADNVPHRASVRIDFTGIAPTTGTSLLFQHRLANETDLWSPPSTSRSVEFPRLAAGRYRFEVRGVTRADTVDVPVAAVSFQALPALWRRPWFLLATGVAIFLATVIGLRVRGASLLEVERARTRIAADLHDGIGTSVSRIGFLGEVARRRLRSAPAEVDEMLAVISTEARELADATADIVWAVDPEHDDLQSLCIRLRRLAADLMESREIALDFQAPHDAAAIRLAPEVRRAFYLCLKESVHNVAKHSRADNAQVLISCVASVLRGEVSDDGVGISPQRVSEAATEGRRGLPGLERRAGAVGGSARMEPGGEGGVRIVVTMPLAPPTGRSSPHGHARVAAGAD